MNGTGPLVPQAREKIKLSLLNAPKEHEWFHSRIKWMPFGKPAWFRELLRHPDLRGRGFPVVLVLKFLLAPARFVRMYPFEHFGNHVEGVKVESAQETIRVGQPSEPVCGFAMMSETILAEARATRPQIRSTCQRRRATEGLHDLRITSHVHFSHV